MLDEITNVLILITDEPDAEILQRWIAWLIVVMVFVLFLLYVNGAFDSMFSRSTDDNQSFGSPYAKEQ